MFCERCQSPLDCESSNEVLFEDVSHVQHTVIDLEASVAAVEDMMERLAQRRTMLRRKINALSPTSRLPPEIVIEIFRLACQSSDDGVHYITPLFFGAICKEWRDIAWSTPILWSSILLRISHTRHDSQLQLLQDWLKRAHKCPLTIKLTSDDEHDETFCSLRAIVDVLLVQSRYWYSLECLLPPQCHDQLKDNHFPNLQSVSFRPPKGTITTFNEPPNMFLSAPKLHDVDFSGYNFPAMVLPWDQLRRFKAQFLTVYECLKVLSQSPNLKECHLGNVYSPALFPSPVPNPVSFDLELLDVTLVKIAAITFLDSITLPSLRELRVSLISGTPLPSISSLVSRSGCNLQHLHMVQHNFGSADEFFTCLQMIPSVTHLRLGSFIYPSMVLEDSVIATLDPSRQPGKPLLPNLKSFEFCGTEVKCSVHSILMMVSNRLRLSDSANTNFDHAVARLTMLDVVSSVPCVIPLGLRQGVKRLSDEGMVVNIRTMSEMNGSSLHF